MCALVVNNEVRLPGHTSSLIPLIFFFPASWDFVFVYFMFFPSFSVFTGAIAHIQRFLTGRPARLDQCSVKAPMSIKLRKCIWPGCLLS
jgi:hypothetical protein